MPLEIVIDETSETLTYETVATPIVVSSAGEEILVITSIPSGGGGGGGVNSVNGKTGVVVLSKTDLGLGNVDNTSDINKPVSTSQNTAINKRLRYLSGTSATGASTAAKTVTIAGETLASSDIVVLALTNGNTANQPSLSVNGGSAYNIYLGGSRVTQAESATTATGIWVLQFDGSRFNMVGSSANLSTVSQAEAEAGVATTARHWTAERVHQAIDALGPRGPFFLPEDYGAVGNGIADDTAALQATFDAAYTAGGGTVILSKRYGWKGDLKHRGAISVHGVSAAKVLVVNDNMDRGLVALDGTARYLYGQWSGVGSSTDDNPGGLYDLVIDGKTVGGVTGGLLIMQCVDGVVQNCRIINSAGNGVMFDGTQNSVLDSTWVGSHVGRNFYFGRIGNLGQGAGSVKINNCYGGTSGMQIYADADPANYWAHDIFFNECLFENYVAGRGMAHIRAGDFQFTRCVFTNSNGGSPLPTNNCLFLVEQDIWPTIPTSVVFDGCYFNGSVGLPHLVRAKTSAGQVGNHVRFYGKTYFFGADYAVALDGGTSFTSSLIIDGDPFYAGGSGASVPEPYVALGDAWLHQVQRRTVMPTRWEIPDDTTGFLPDAITVKRRSDAANRFQINRDGLLRWLDGVNGSVTQAVIGYDSVADELQHGGRLRVMNSLALRAITQFISGAGIDITISANPESAPASLLVFQFANASADVSIIGGVVGSQLQIILYAPGVTGALVNWPASAKFYNDDAPQPPTAGGTTIVTLTKVAEDEWHEVSRSGGGTGGGGGGGNNVDLFDLYAISQLDRNDSAARIQSGGQSAIDYAGATEIVEDWSDLTGVLAVANAQVSGNRQYAIGAGAPGGWKKDIAALAGDGLWRIDTTIHYKTGNAGAVIAFGINTKPAGSAQIANDPDSLYVAFVGAGRQAVAGSNLTAMNKYTYAVLGANPTTDVTYAVSIVADEEDISFTMANVDQIQELVTWSVERADFPSGKTVNSVAGYLTDSRGTAGHSFGPVVVTLGSIQPPRTKKVAGQQVVAQREMLMRRANGDAGPNNTQVYALPPSYDPRKPSPLVLWSRQSVSGAAWDMWEEAKANPVTAALLDAGYIIAGVSDVDNPAGWSMGTQRSLDEQHDLYEWLRSNFNIGPLFWYGASMGGLDIANSIADRKFPTPAAVAVIGGAFDIGHIWDLGAPFRALVETAWSASGRADLLVKSEGYDPIRETGSAFRGVPWRFYTSAGDTIVPPAKQDEFAALVAPYAPESDVVIASGAHLDASQYQAADVLEFFNRYRYEQREPGVFDGSMDTGGAGTITSVNGDAGPTVVLDAADVGAQKTVLAVTTATAAATVAKTATVGGYVPVAGDEIALTFTSGNTATAPTLSIDGGTAYAIYQGGSAATLASLFVSGNAVVKLRFNGSRWDMSGLASNFDAISQALAEAGTSTTAGWWTPQRVSQAIAALAQSKFVPGTSSTAIGTAAKTVTISGFTPTANSVVVLTLTNGNSAASPTLAVNGGSAIPIHIAGAAATAANSAVAAGGVWILYYNGTNFILTGSTQNTDTTYSVPSQAEAEAGTSTTARAFSAQRVKQASVKAAARFVQWAKVPDSIITGTITRNANDVVTSAGVVWPDGATGTFTTDTIGTLNTIDAYHISYSDGTSTLTFTQPLITRNANGLATNVPAIVVT